MAVAKKKAAKKKATKKKASKKKAAAKRPRGRPLGSKLGRPQNPDHGGEAATKSSDFERKLKAEADLKERQAHLKQIEVDETLGRLIDAREVDKMLADRVRVMKKGLLRLGDRLAPEVVNLDIRGAKNVIDEAAKDLIREYSGE